MIETTTLSKRFGDHLAVDQLTFTAKDGMVTGYLGPNGAGKTTAFRMILGLAAPTSGQALINGVPYAQLADPRRSVGAVLESSGFHPGRSGRNHLRIIATAAGLPQSRVAQVLAMVGLAKAADRTVGGYSMGMRQRLALAAALLGDPQTLILDEPTNGLDPAGITWFRSLLRDWAREGRCVVVSSHVLAEVAQAVDQVIIVKEGRVVHQADVSATPEQQSLRVRCADPSRLADLVRQVGGSARLQLGMLVVEGMHQMELGHLAATAGIAVFELAPWSDSESLEDLFLRLTTTAAELA